MQLPKNSYSDKIRLRITADATRLPLELQEICQQHGNQINVLCSI